MPVYVPAIEVAGLTEADLSPSFHVALPETLGLEFLLARGSARRHPAASPIPFLRNVISIGRRPPRGRDRVVPVLVDRARPVRRRRRASSPCGAADRSASSCGGVGGRDPLGIDRPSSSAAAWARASARRRPRRRHARSRSRGAACRSRSRDARSASASREHPYVRLLRAMPGSPRSGWPARSASSATACTRSRSGVMVFAITGSALQTGLVFLAATLPNLLLGPIAGTFVDRWDQKRVMIVSDLAAGGARPRHPVRRRGRDRARLCARLRHHDGQPLLPARQGRDPASHRAPRRT